MTTKRMTRPHENAQKSHQGNYTLMDHGHSNMQTPRASAHKPTYRGPAQRRQRRRRAGTSLTPWSRSSIARPPDVKTSAMQMARRLYPELFRDYNSSAAQVQQASRSGTNEYAKRARVYREDLIAAEVAKGCNAVVAEQRVMQMWGNAVPPSVINKGRDLTEQFQDEVEFDRG